MSPRWVSEAFSYTNDEHHAFVREALETIDGFHEDGVLDRYDIRLEAIYSAGGRELEGLIDPDTRIITINPNGASKRFTLLHEIGHVLDFSLGIWTSIFAGDRPELDEWVDAVQESKLIREYQKQAADADGAALHTLKLLLEPPEVWARSYAQYIASRCLDGSPLRSELDAGFSIDPKTHFAEQWEPVDFQSIDVALHSAFSYWRGYDDCTFAKATFPCR